jgi:hypothetical protein
MPNLNGITDIFSGEKWELITNSPGPTGAIVVTCFTIAFPVCWLIMQREINSLQQRISSVQQENSYLDRQLKDEKGRNSEKDAEIKTLQEQNEKLKEQNENFKISIDKLHEGKGVQRVLLKKEALITVKQARNFFEKAESEVEANYPLPKLGEALTPYYTMSQLEKRSDFISKKIKYYEMNFENDVQALTKTIINILKKENKKFDESQLLEEQFEKKSFKSILKELKYLQLIAWELLENI